MILKKCLRFYNSIQFFIYLRADSTAIGLLQSQHGHMQQKQWTAQRQYTKQVACTGKYQMCT
jgi:hypothetical protein